MVTLAQRSVSPRNKSFLAQKVVFTYVKIVEHRYSLTRILADTVVPRFVDIAEHQDFY